MRWRDNFGVRRPMRFEWSGCVEMDARQCGGPQRKATEKDLFGNDAMQGMLEGTRQDFDVKDFRMQGNYGHTKFIKP